MVRLDVNHIFSENMPSGQSVLISPTSYNDHHIIADNMTGSKKEFNSEGTSQEVHSIWSTLFSDQQLTKNTYLSLQVLDYQSLQTK